MNRKQLLLAAFALLTPFVGAALFGAEIERSIPADAVKPNAVVLEWTADHDAALSGYFVRLANCLPPRDEPIVAALSVNGQRVGENVAIPIFPYPLLHHTLPYTHGSQTIPPLDVGREYRRAVGPIALRQGDVVAVAIESCGPEIASGVTAGLQFQGRRPLAEMRNPFRECRTNGPVCSIPWSEPECVAVGTQEKFDPRCAPQNNSSVIADRDGTLYIFCAYYSVDEQYGGGRGGSYSRIVGFKKAPDAEQWEDIGIVVDLMEGATYSGDPFVFRDLEGRPCLLFCFCDGTNGFADWKLGGNYVLRSETDSFSGPWSDPIPLWSNYPREPDDNKTGGRANCVRIFPRQETQDYLVVWNHGAQDMDVRGVVVKNFDEEITHEQLGDAMLFSKNQEEGGGGFTYGNKGYYSTWQIPWRNDPNGLQRLYEVDLTEPLTPASWRVVPGSIGFNDGSNPKRDGGTTADAWAISVANDRVWATSCEYSATEKKNYLYVRSAPLDAFEKHVESVKPDDVVFRYGAVRVPTYHEVFPTIEYALGQQCSLEFDFTSYGDLSYAFISLGPSDVPNESRSLFFEMNPDGTRLVAYKDDATRHVLAEQPEPTWEPGKTYRLKLVRNGARFAFFVDGEEALDVTIDDEEILRNANDEPRFRLYGWQGGRYEIANAVLVDGKE